jgi:hypothetical protein
MTVRFGWFLLFFTKPPPELADTDSLGRKHAILQTIQISSVNGRHELS